MLKNTRNLKVVISICKNVLETFSKWKVYILRFLYSGENQ